MLVKVAVVKHLGENFFGEDVLDQHFAHIGIGEARVDGFLRVGQEFLFGLAEAGIGFVLALDHLAQRVQHHGQIGLELLHRRAETGDFGPLKAEKKFEQLGQPGGVRHVAAQDFVFVLHQNGSHIVGKDDVVLRIAFFEFLADLFVEVVARVLGFPVAQRHTQFVQQRAIHGDVAFGGGLERVFGQKHQALLFAPGLEQVLEGFAHDGLARTPADLFDEVELLEVIVDEKLAH